jgi:hypothetical protein
MFINNLRSLFYKKSFKNFLILVMITIIFFMLKGNYNLVENMTLQEELSNSSKNAENGRSTSAGVASFSNAVNNSFEPFIESMNQENNNMVGTGENNEGSAVLERIQNINKTTKKMNSQ